MKSPLVFRVFKKDQIHVIKQYVDEDRITVGNGGDVHIDLDSNEVSPIHCLIEKRDDQYFLCDLGSTQGTYKNGQRVLDESLQSGDSFQVGPFHVFFFIGVPKADQVMSPPAAPPVRSEPVSAAVVASAAVAATAVSRAAPVTRKKKKGQKTFPPPSKVTDLREHLKAGSGPRVEVLVAWKERILETYHFTVGGKKTLGPDGDINVPQGASPKNWEILDLTNGAVIHTTSEMSIERLKDGEVSKQSTGDYRLGQGEVCFIELINGMQLIVRFAPKAPAFVMASPMVLGSSEFAGVLAALIIAVLTSLIVSVNKPKETVVETEVERLAQITFVTPTTPPPQTVSAVAPPTPPPAPEVKKPEPEPLKKAIMLDETKSSKTLGETKAAANKAPQEAQKESGKAAEVKPKDNNLTTKMFTSTKQGGAIQTGQTTGANAQSAEPDNTNSGLLAAFGEGGARSKLDQVYSGAGELIGTAEKAQGVSGFGNTREGSDLGSQIKDTGAGGVGTATEGIAGVGTKGRGTGMSGYGGGAGFGDKDRVQIAAGGNEEAFTGSIDREAVRRTVRSALQQFKSCYEREYRVNSSLEGKLVLTWEIHAQGMARNARVNSDRSTMRNTSVEECIKARILGLRFPEPPPGTAAEVTYPFVFQGQKL